MLSGSLFNVGTGFTCQGIGISSITVNSFTCTRLLGDIANTKNVKRCRDGMPKSMQTR